MELSQLHFHHILLVRASRMAKSKRKRWGNKTPVLDERNHKVTSHTGTAGVGPSLQTIYHTWGGKKTSWMKGYCYWALKAKWEFSRQQEQSPVGGTMCHLV